jgi:ribonuclease Z
MTRGCWSTRARGRTADAVRRGHGEPDHPDLHHAFPRDHCLGLPGVLARMSLDRVSHPVEACYPAQNQEVFTRLRHAALFRDAVDLRERRVKAAGTVLSAAAFHVEARPLSHTAPAIGYRLVEADGRRMLPDKLAAFGVTGPDIGRLQHEGCLVIGDRLVTVEQVSEPRRGQRFAFIMDTRLCDAAFELADGADMLVCESTFADAEATPGPRVGTPDRRAGRPHRGRGRGAAARAHSFLAALRA